MFINLLENNRIVFYQTGDYTRISYLSHEMFKMATPFRTVLKENNRIVFYQTGDYTRISYLSHEMFKMATPFRTVLKSLNVISFLGFHSTLVKLIPKSMICQGLSSQIHSLRKLSRYACPYTNSETAISVQRLFN